MLVQEEEGRAGRKGLGNSKLGVLEECVIGKSSLAWATNFVAE